MLHPIWVFMIYIEAWWNSVNLRRCSCGFLNLKVKSEENNSLLECKRLPAMFWFAILSFCKLDGTFHSQPLDEHSTSPHAHIHTYKKYLYIHIYIYIYIYIYITVAGIETSSSMVRRYLVCHTDSKMRTYDRILKLTKLTIKLFVHVI